MRLSPRISRLTGDLAAQRSILLGKLTVVECVARRQQNAFLAAVLFEKIESADARRLHRFFDGCVAGENHDELVRVMTHDVLQDFYAILLRHTHVEVDDVERLLGEAHHCLITIGGACGFPARIAVDHLHRRANVFLVVNDEHSSSHDLLLGWCVLGIAGRRAQPAAVES